MEDYLKLQAIKEARQYAHMLGGSISTEKGTLVIFRFALVIRDFNIYDDLHGNPQRVAIVPYDNSAELDEILSGVAVENDIFKYGFFVPLIALISITCNFVDLNQDCWTNAENKAIRIAEKDGIIYLKGNCEPWTV